MSVAETFPDGLRVPQLEGALRIFDSRSILLADQPGAGKTAQALVALELDDAFRRTGYVTLILCNVTGCQLTWGPELQRRVASQFDVVIADLTDTEGKKTMPSTAARDKRLRMKWLEAQEQGLPLIVLANFEAVRWKFRSAPKIPTLFQIPLSAVIIDEGHLVLPTKEDADSKVTQFWYGLQQLRILPNAIRADLTGTPDRGKLHHRYGHWKFLFPSRYQNFWAWCRSMFIVTEGEWGGAEIGKLRDPKLWRSYDEQHMIRRTKAEMLKGLPEKQWANDGGIDLPMTQAQMAAYEDYQEYLEMREAELIEQEKMGEAQALKLQFALRGRQMATCTWDFVEAIGDDGRVHTTGIPRVAGPEASNKLAWLLNWLDDRAHYGDEADPAQGKVVIVSYFTQVLHWLAAELKNETGLVVPIIAGDTPAPEKLRIEEAFQRGSLRIVLLSGYMGVSINLDAADDMIFVDSVHDPDRMEQAEDRIHRASRSHQVTYWRLASIGTVDMAVLNVLDSRYRETRKTYDGDRGVAFARRMLPKIATPEGAVA